MMTLLRAAYHVSRVKTTLRDSTLEATALFVDQTSVRRIQPVRPKNPTRAARPLRGAIAGGAVLVGIAALVFGLAPEQLSTATAARTAATVRFTVNEGTNISISRPADGQSIIMDLHGFLYRIPGQGGQAVRITDVFLDSSRPEISPNGQQI